MIKLVNCTSKKPGPNGPGSNFASFLLAANARASVASTAEELQPIQVPPMLLFLRFIPSFPLSLDRCR